MSGMVTSRTNRTAAPPSNTLVVRLGPFAERLTDDEFYRPKAKVEILACPRCVSGEPLLKVFTLDLTGILD